MPALIQHSASLVCQLFDATSGAPVMDIPRFLADGVLQSPISKPSGHHVFLEPLPDTFVLETRVLGYEPDFMTVTRGEKDSALEFITVDLIPNPTFNRSPPCLTLEGRMKGINGIDAVRFSENTCLFREFDERKRVMTILNPHHLELHRTRYAVANPETQSYEPFVIVKRISDTAFKIDKPLEGEHAGNCPVSPVIPGAVGGDGNFLLRVRDVYSDLRYIVRWQREGKTGFKLIDFHEPETMRLE